MCPKSKKKRPTPAKDYARRYRKLFLKAERIWKEVCHLRDGQGCQVQKHYPMAKLQHSEVYQIDHFITRGDKNLFFNPRNGTKVCSICNMAKKNKTGAVEERIRAIVIKREGGFEVGVMTDIHLSHEPNYRWKDADWLEYDVIPMLEDYKLKLDRLIMETL